MSSTPSVIKRIYIDNFRSFENFEWAPERFHLLFGKNGRGKTSVMDVLGILKQFIVEGSPARDLFLDGELTAWLGKRKQTFEVDFEGEFGTICYRLVLEHHEYEAGKCRIRSEEVKSDNGFLYKFDGSDAHLFKDGGKAGPSFPYDWSRSAITTIPERGDNMALTWFREQWRRLLLFSPNPSGMSADADREMPYPDRSLSKIVAWLRHLSQDSFDAVARIQSELREVMPGFDQFQLSQSGETTRTLKLAFTSIDGRKGHKLSFSQLSEGQRQLFALYVILGAALEKPCTVFIDEPDNFVALREIQPWLMALRDKVEDSVVQVILISHHPEVIDALAPDSATWFFREGAGHSRCKTFEPDREGGLKASEIVSRDLVEGCPVAGKVRLAVLSEDQLVEVG